MALNPGELIDPGPVEEVRREVLAFLQEQAMAGADPDVLSDLGYPNLDDDTDFNVYAPAGEPADPEPEQTPAEPAQPPDRRRQRPRARTVRDKAARDSRPDLKPWPYGTRED